MIRRTNPSAQLCVVPYINDGSPDVTLLAEIRLFFRRGRLDRWDEEAHRRRSQYVPVRSASCGAAEPEPTVGLYTAFRW